VAVAALVGLGAFNLLAAVVASLASVWRGEPPPWMVANAFVGGVGAAGAGVLLWRANALARWVFLLWLASPLAVFLVVPELWTEPVAWPASLVFVALVVAVFRFLGRHTRGAA
jgi:hypothetical protein